MAKISFQDVLSGYLTAAALNANFSLIEQQLQDKVLYRDNTSGETNQMENSLDMNSNRILNLPFASASTEPVTLGQLIATSGSFIFSGTYIEEQVATENQTLFVLNSLTYEVGTGNISIYINGVRQSPSAYAETTLATVTFTEPLVEGDEVLFVVNERQTETVGGGGGGTGNFNNPANASLNMNGLAITNLPAATIGSNPATFQQLLDLETIVTAAQSQLNTNTSQIGTIQSDISSVESDISSINSELSTLVLKTTDLGVTVQSYDADIPTVTASNGEMTAGTETALRSMSPALVASAISALGGGGSGGDVTGPVSSVDNRIATFDGTTGKVIQDSGILLSGLLTSSDIGTTVQGYDADTAKYDDATANFTGTLQNGGSNVVVDTDIGSSVQAYDADIAVVAASQVEMEAGTETALRSVSPLRVKQAIDALSVGAGDVDGPASAVDGNVPTFDGTTGKLLQDGGVALSSLLTSSAIGTTVQAYDADLSAIAALAKPNSGFIVGDGSTWVLETGETVRNSLGLGALAGADTISNAFWSGTDLAIVNGGTGSSTASDARTALGVAIGSDVQEFMASASQGEAEAGTETALRAFSPLRIKQAIDALAPGGGGGGVSGPVSSTVNNIVTWNSTTGAVVKDSAISINDILETSDIGSAVQAYDVDLTALGGLSKTDSNFIVGNGSTWVTESGSTVRTSLGLGSLATKNTVNNTDWSGTVLSTANGGTGSGTASGARTNLGLAIGTDVQAYDPDIPTVSASQAEMEAGTQTALRSMSPLRVKQAIDALSAGGGSTNVGVFDTISALTSNTTSTYAMAYVRGYTADDDGGEGWFYKDSADVSSSANTGMIVVDSGSRRWKRYVPTDEISVKWFGAKGNGSTNDTTAIQAAIDFAAATDVYQKIRVPYSELGYVVSHNVIQLPNDMQLLGSDAKHQPSKFPGVSSLKKGSTFYVTAGSGTTTGQVVLMNNGAVINGINFIWPNQTSTSTPLTYPPAIRFNGGTANGVQVLNIMMANPYIGIDMTGGHGDARIKNIVMQPIHRGIIVDNCIQVDTFEDILMAPTFNLYGDGSNATNTGHILYYMAQNAVCFEMRQIDGFVIENFSSFNQKIGIWLNNLAALDYGPVYGFLFNSNLENLKYGIYSDNNGINTNGIYCSNVAFVDVSPGNAESYAIYLRSCDRARIALNACEFHGTTAEGTRDHINIDSGKVLVNGSLFGGWGNTYAAIRCSGSGTASSVGSHFLTLPTSGQHVYWSSSNNGLFTNNVLQNAQTVTDVGAGTVTTANNIIDTVTF